MESEDDLEEGDEEYVKTVGSPIISRNNVAYHRSVVSSFSFHPTPPRFLKKDIMVKPQFHLIAGSRERGGERAPRLGRERCGAASAGWTVGARGSEGEEAIAAVDSGPRPSDLSSSGNRRRAPDFPIMARTRRTLRSPVGERKTADASQPIGAVHVDRPLFWPFRGWLGPATTTSESCGRRGSFRQFTIVPLDLL